MKNLFLIPCLFFAFCSVNAQGTWTSKAKFGGGQREAGTSFVISGKAYVYGGVVSGSYYSDLWEYDPGTNTWTQKASMPGSGRAEAVSFVVNDIGYVGIGLDGSGHYQTFYKYDPTTNKWASIADFPKDWRAAGAFAIDSLGYVIGGMTYSGGTVNRTLYSYSPKLNKWTTKASLPSSASARAYPCMVACNGKGYMIGGYIGGNYFADMFEYNPVTDQWKSLSDFAGDARVSARAFVINNKIYCGSGKTASKHCQDWFEYDVAKDEWTAVSDYPVNTTYGHMVFSVGGKGYVVGGQNSGTTYSDKTYEFSAPVAGVSDIAKVGPIQFYQVQGTNLVRFTSLKSNSNFWIWDVNGKLQSQGMAETGSSELILENLKSGIYFLKMNNSVIKIQL